MIITFDSNIAEIPDLVSSKLERPATLWCTGTNICERKSKSSIYYNTPLSMSDDLSKHVLPTDMKSFIYLDYSQKNATMSRILNNIKMRNDIVIISNADVLAVGTYQMRIGNCSNSDIAQVIAALITMFKRTKTLIHPDELKQLLYFNNNDHDTTYHSIPATENMSCDVCSMLEYKRNNNYEIDDCKECKL